MTPLQRYYALEDKIRKFEANAGASSDVICENPDMFSEHIQMGLKKLLLEKKYILQDLGADQRKKIAGQSVVNLAEFRRYTKRRS